MRNKYAEPVCRWLLPLALCTLLPAQSTQTNSFADPNGRFTLVLPSQWTAMPAATLEEFRGEARNAGLQGADYVLGFVRDSRAQNPSWILVGRAPLHGVSESDFADPDFARHMLGAAQRNERLAKVVSGVNLLESHYETSRHVLWMKYEMATEGVNVRGLSGIYRTSSGTLQVNCYAASTVFESREPEFREIIGSLKMEDSLQYRPTALERLLPNVSSRIRVLLVGGACLLVVACVVCLVVTRRGKRSSQYYPANCPAAFSTASLGNGPVQGHYWPPSSVGFGPVSNVGGNATGHAQFPRGINGGRP